MTQPAKNPTATIETSEGSLTVEFWPDVAFPTRVDFIRKTRRRFYGKDYFSSRHSGIHDPGRRSDGDGDGLQRQHAAEGGTQAGRSSAAYPRSNT